MTYHRAHALSGLTDVASAAVAVVGDPCLAEVSNLVVKLRASSAGPSTPGQPAGPPTKGIGLCRAVKPLKAAVWLSQRPWVLPVAVTAIVGGIFMAGRISR